MKDRMNERTLTDREKAILGALAAGAEKKTARRAQALLEWARGAPTEEVADTVNMRHGHVQSLLRSFAQKRLEVFAPAALERAGRGLAGCVTVEDLLREYHVDVPHADHTRQLALELYDATQSLHGLDAAFRRLLETGAWLHDVGLAADWSQHHRAGCDILLSHELDSLAEWERDVIALLALFHRKKVRPTRDPVFQALEPEVQRATLVLAAILRVADGLDDSETQTTRLAAIQLDDLVDAVVEGPHAERDARRANKKADLWQEALPLPFHARLADQAAPSAESQKRAPLLVTVRGKEPITRAGKQVVARQWARIQTSTEAVREGSETSAVHDMRVAARRMRTALRLVDAYASEKKLRKLVSPLRDVIQALGRVRDLDVLLEHARDYAASLPPEGQGELEGLVQDWKARREHAHRRLVRYMDSPAYANWAARVNRYLEGGDKNAPRVCDVAPALIWKRYGKVRAFETRLDQRSVETLHALRIQCKRLRYSIEFFADAMDPRAQELLPPLVALQDHLGRLHDTDVARSLATEFLAARARYALDHQTEAGNLGGVTTYLNALQAELAQLQEGLVEHWHVIVKPPFREALASALAAM